MSRTEVQVQVQTTNGSKIITILSDVTVDDLMRLGVKAYVTEARGGAAYSSPYSREIREAVIRTRTTQRA